MATAERMRAPLEQPVEKGLKPGALGLVSTTVITTASVARHTASLPRSCSWWRRSACRRRQSPCSRSSRCC